MNPTFLIKIGNLTASLLLSLANSVIAGLTAAVATYPTPNPSVATLTADALTLSNAIIARGRKSTPGGALATATLANAVEVMHADLIQVSKYIMNTTPSDQLGFLSAGFATSFIHPKGFKAIRTQQRPRNLRALVRRDVNPTDVYLKWKRQLGGHRPLYGKVINNVWDVLRSPTANEGDFELIATVTKTQHTDQLGDRIPPAGNFFYYKIIGISRNGKSVTSDIVKVLYNQPA